jgi:hypothetical protein
MAKRCLICETEIKSDDVTVCDATVWKSHGNFGSAVYDPLDDRVFLEAFICDACLIRKKGFVEEVVVTRPHEVLERRPPSF